jgi:hypothetical protein
MDWSTASPDQIDRGLDHFGGLQAAAIGEICTLIQAVDHAQMWMGDGARSLAEWVGARLRLRFSTARRLVAVARRLEDLPHLSSCLARGELSLDQVEALSRMASPETEEELVADALGLPNHVLDRWARLASPPSARDARDVWDRRRLVRQWNLDESELKFWGNLPGETGQVFDDAIQERLQQIPENPETGMFDPTETRAADALVDLVATTGALATPPQISLHADLSVLTGNESGPVELAGGALISIETARRLACDSVVEIVVQDGKIVVGVGRNSRVVPGWLRRLVHHRDGGRCQFPGCGGRLWLHVHHRIHWLDGGRTDLDNLVLLCSFHHRFVHEHGWSVGATPGGHRFHKADGSSYPRPKEALHPRLEALIEAGRPT